jgi:segregation and condensation protein A
VEAPAAETAAETVPGAAHQEEMPFAIVQGHPVTRLPLDLYIPPDALEVFLEAFEGPLDLLLYLIRRQNLDILDIPIAEITRQYMSYIDMLRELQFELASEYLVMAAILAEIKSRMLLPSWCAGCRNTNASSRRPRTSTRCRARTAISRCWRHTSRTAR